MSEKCPKCGAEAWPVVPKANYIEWRCGSYQYIGAAERQSALCASRAEVAELKAELEWKERTLKVMPDLERIVELLGLPLGTSVPPEIVPAIERMQAELAALEPLRRAAKEYYEIDAIRWKGEISMAFDPLELGLEKAKDALLKCSLEYAEKEGK